jgi:phosphopantetheinyl transferase
MSRVILYHARLPDRLGLAEAGALLERIPYAKRVTLAPRRAEREASLVGIALALAAAGQVRGREIPPGLLRYPPGGRPTFAGDGAPVFSISHAERVVVAAATATGVLGIDVEHAGSSRLHPDLRREWSAREAVVKALGQGLCVAAEVQLLDGRARLRGRELALCPVRLPDGVEVWVATDFAPAAVEVEMRDPLSELRRHAA